MATFRGRGGSAVLPVFCALGILCLANLLAPLALQAQSLPLYTVNHFDNQLRTIDPLTGATLTNATITLADQTVTGGWGLAKHPNTGQFFAILQVAGARRLVTIDPSNGAATDIGDTGHRIGGITFRKDSGGVVTLYGIAGNSDPTNPDTLFSLDLATGAPTLVLAFGNGNMGETVAFNPADGLLYRAYGSGVPNVDQFFVSVDPVTLAVTNLPLTGDSYSQATTLTHWAGNIFLLADHGKHLFVVTLVGGSAQVRQLSTLQGGVGDTKGLLFSAGPPACPPLAPLYGAANIGPNGPSLLFSLDPATGAPTLIGPIGFERVSGIAFNLTGSLYGTGESQDGTNTNFLLYINPCTGEGAVVGATAIQSFETETDISFRKADGILFAYLLGEGRALATLDLLNGNASLVGNPNTNGAGNGIAFSPIDTLFHADNQNLNTLDPGTGAATLVTALNLSAFVDHECVLSAAVNALDFQPGTGTLFASVTDGNQCFVPTRQQNYLATIDTTTGVVTKLGETQTGLDAIAFSPTAGAPTTITTGGNGSGSQSTVIYTPFALPLQAVVKDSGGNPVPGVSVTFTLPGSGASGTFPGAVLSAQVTTDASGVATSPILTANGTVGTFTATGTVSGIATPANYLLTNTLSAGATITVNGGGSGTQSTVIHTPFALPLQAVVKDSGGTPVPGVTVTFAGLPSSGASATFPGGVAAVVTTDASGTATSPTLTANGTVGGPYTATGTVSGIATPANYSLTNTLSTGATIGTGGNGSGSQTTTIHTPFALPLQAIVKDSDGTPVPGVSVTFTLPGSGASGTFPGAVLSAQVTTDASGVATSPIITANGTVGTFTATGTVSGIATPANYLLTNTLSAGATIGTGGNGSGSQSTVIHTPFALPLQAVVKDSGGTPVPGVTVTFAGLPSSGASATFPGGVAAVVTTDASGTATSPTITANGTVGGPYTATGTVSGIATPANYSLTNTLSSGATIGTGGNGSGSQTTTIHTPFALPLQAIVKDSDGTPVPGVSVTFTVPSSGASGTFPGAVLSAQVTTDASGVATSPIITANGTVGGPYTATGTVSGIATPANYSLTNTLSTGATISTGGNGSGSQSTIIYRPFALPLQAVVKDSGGTPVPGVTVTFAGLPSSGASATFPGGVSAVVTTDASGTATSPTLTANGTVGGPYTATGTVSGIATPANYSLTNTLSSGATIGTGGNGSGTQSTIIHTPFALPLQAVVMDVGPSPDSKVTEVRGNSVGSLVPVPGVKVTFTVPGSGASGTFPGGALSVQVTTDGSGVATSPTITANGTVGGPYTATGAVSGIETPANYSLTNTLSSGATITTGGNGSGSQTTVVHTPFALPLQATVKDSGGTPVPGVTVTFTVPSSGASGTFTGGVLTVQVTTDGSGVATSPTLTANGTAGGPYTATGTVTGIATPANYSLTNTAGSPKTITATGGTPQRAALSTAFPLPLQATVKDNDGNLVPGVTVTFTPPGSGASGAFATNTAVTNASGVATSATFTANSTSGNYTVNATVTGAATPAPFALTNVDFSVAATTPSQTVPPGGTANYTLSFTAIADKSVNPTTFACQNLPAASACVFNPLSLPADSGNTPFGLAISTTPRPTTAGIGSGGGLPPRALPAALLALLGMIAMSLASFAKRVPGFARPRAATLGLLAALLLMVGYVAGCGAVGTGFPPGGSGVQGTPAGTFSVTVVATSGTLQRTTTVSLTVQ